MGSLLNSNRVKSNSLDRGKRIEPENSMSIKDLSNPGEQSKSSKIESVTYYANVRINNHIKIKRRLFQSLVLPSHKRTQLIVLWILL